MTASVSSSSSTYAELGICIMEAVGMVAGIMDTNGMNVVGGTKLVGGGYVQERVTSIRKSLTACLL